MGKKENVLRVKKDEADARAREEEKSKRALLAVSYKNSFAAIPLFLSRESP